MSVQSAENFITNCYENLDEQLKDIMKNVNSKFESSDTKAYYICERARECGYNFTPKELMAAFKRLKFNFKKTRNFIDSTKNFNITNFSNELFNENKNF